jgi:ribonucleoside-diphosphate reductase alpha chain
MEGIFNTLRDAALIHKTGGGTGFSFSRLRAKNSVVKSTGGIASGPISFMKAYNAATETVKQGGKRRGANMGMLRIDHPDIEDFINCKKDKTELTNFNISVAVTDVFMDAVKEEGTYDLIDPRSGKVVDTIPAKPIWDKIVAAAWESGEPGIFFIDRANAANPTPALGKFEATNPCGEQPLLPYESCNLGSINLLNMCTDKGINYTKLDRTIELAVRFLDNVIDINTYPLPEIEKATKLTRKIGLGVMGWADMLLRLNIPYNSVRALELAEKLMKYITDTARDCSRLLGKDRGSFPAKDISIWKDEKFMRNAALTTIAPTGTISMIADVSSGIEPIFGYAFTKTVMDNDSFVYVNEILKERLLANGLYTQSTVDSLLKSGRVTALDNVPEDIKEVFVCAYDIAANDHIRMQASFQKYTDNAISKTINFPNTATIEDVNDGYILAYNLGCKGVTVYRDGSRDSQVLNLGTGDKKVRPRDRAATTQGFTDKITTGCGNLYITVNYDEHGICEVFTNTSKAGGCPAQSEASARLATLALRANVDHDSIIRQLAGIRCPAAVRNKNSQCLSCPDAIARSLKKAIGYKVDSLKLAVQEEDNATVPCPECGKPILNAEGCTVCPSCGFSKCN